MSQPTPTVAKLLDFQLGTYATPNVLVNVSDNATEASIDRNADLPDATTFNSGGSKSYAGGLVDRDVKAEFIWDTTIDAMLKAIVGVPVSFQYGEIGSASGNPKTTGKMIISKLSKPQKVGDILKFSIDGKTTGAIVEGYYA